MKPLLLIAMLLLLGCSKQQGDMPNRHMKFINQTNHTAVIEIDCGTQLELLAGDTINTFDGHGSTNMFGYNYSVYTVRIGKVHYEYSSTITYVNYINF